MKLSINIDAISMCDAFKAEISRSDFPSYALALVALALDLPDLKAKLTDEIMKAGCRPRANSSNIKRISLKDGSYVHARVLELSELLSLPASQIFERLCAISWKNRQIAQASMDSTPPTAVSSQPTGIPARLHQPLQETRLTPPQRQQAQVRNEPSDPDATDYSSFPSLEF
jgi:hypothetical protein